MPGRFSGRLPEDSPELPEDFSEDLPSSGIKKKHAFGDASELRVLPKVLGVCFRTSGFAQRFWHAGKVLGVSRHFKKEYGIHQQNG